MRTLRFGVTNIHLRRQVNIGQETIPGMDTGRGTQGCGAKVSSRGWQASRRSKGRTQGGLDRRTLGSDGTLPRLDVETGTQTRTAGRVARGRPTTRRPRGRAMTASLRGLDRGSFTGEHSTSRVTSTPTTPRGPGGPPGLGGRGSWGPRRPGLRAVGRSQTGRLSHSLYNWVGTADPGLPSRFGGVGGKPGPEAADEVARAPGGPRGPIGHRRPSEVDKGKEYDKKGKEVAKGQGPEECNVINVKWKVADNKREGQDPDDHPRG